MRGAKSDSYSYRGRQYRAMTEERLAGILELNGHGLADTHSVYDLCMEVLALKQERDTFAERLNRLDEDLNARDGIGREITHGDHE
jgi:hypothetical protein